VEFVRLKSLVEKESAWLSAVTERDQILSGRQGGELGGFSTPGQRTR
jgi:hypothetical protein